MEVRGRLRGLFPATPTPFDAQGSLALEELARNLLTWNRQPLDGYVLLGSNGEAVLLTVEERVRLVRAARPAVPAERLLIAGAGMESTAETIELARLLAAAGADAVIVVTPHYYRGRMTAAALEGYYEQVADAAPVPVILYSVPANTGIDLPIETVARLAQHGNILGVKDSGGDVVKIGRMVQAVPPGFAVLAGSAGFLLAALSVGAVGGVMALANLAAEPLARLLAAVKVGDLDTARRLQGRLLEPNLAVTARFGVAGLKAALDVQGLYGGPVRPPLLPLGAEDKAALVTVLARGGLLPGDAAGT
ncbi:MAG: hypothetical protein A2Y93_14070 [Chloroflexi bacterium RBG_13_68_17]|nr:MAG: hypothetical protein A2Y93_14070 [Chloroflexi bacterium RBG_13_68_17]